MVYSLPEETEIITNVTTLRIFHRRRYSRSKNNVFTISPFTDSIASSCGSIKPVSQAVNYNKNKGTRKEDYSSACFFHYPEEENNLSIITSFYEKSPGLQPHTNDPPYIIK